LEKELRDDIDNDIFQEIKASYEKLQHMSAFHLKEDIQGLKDFIKSLTKLPVAIDDALKIPKDLAKMLSGIEAVIEEVKEEGTTALLKSTLYELLNNDGKRDYLKASDNQDYRDLYQSLATPPLTVSIENKPWMESDKEPYQQDWFFGYLQTAGFNTTNLLAVREDHQEAKSAVVLASLLEKMPLTDQILQSVLNDNNVSLASAVAERRLYICDYTMLVGKKSNALHGKQRYVTAPIAVFYWSNDRAAGFPETNGYMQPIAIQLDQQHDAIKTPIFTPNDSSDANDINGLKWHSQTNCQYM
jgi:arachidonate 15-lipoxygenase